MWICKTSRNQFLELLGGQTVVSMQQIDRFSAIQPYDLPKNDDLVLVIKEGGKFSRSLPEAIMVEEGRLADFLAWANTFVASFRPISSFCRIFESHRIIELEHRRRAQPLEAWQEPAAGLTIAEALTHGRGRVNQKTLTVSACESTYSFARAQSLALGYVDVELLLADQWTKARRVFSQPDRIPGSREMERIWTVLCRISSRNAEPSSAFGEEFDEIADAAQELARSGELSLATLSRLTKGHIEGSALVTALAGSREQRVLAFEKAVRELSRSNEHKTKAAFLAGYIACQMNPGVLEYIDSALGFADEFPDLLLWYGLCTALVSKHRGNGLQFLGPLTPLGRRIVRDFSYPGDPLDPPRADISADELEVVSRTRDLHQQLHLPPSGAVCVEFLPNVIGMVKTASPPQSTQIGLFDNREATDWIRDVEDALRRLNDVFHRRWLAPRDAVKESTRRKRYDRGDRSRG